LAGSWPDSHSGGGTGGTEFRKIGKLHIFAANEMFYKMAQNCVCVELEKKF
jgi:hypothetical protein